MEEKIPIQQAQKRKTGMGIAGFILGLLSIALVLFTGLSIILAILGFIFSLIQIKRNKTKLAIAGLILSIIGFIAAIIILVAVYAWTYISLKNMEEAYDSQSGIGELFGNSIEGYVYDQDNLPIEGVNIRFHCYIVTPDYTSNSTTYDITNKDGHFSVIKTEDKGLCTLTASISNIEESLQVNLEEYSPPIYVGLPVEREDIT